VINVILAPIGDENLCYSYACQQLLHVFTRVTNVLTESSILESKKHETVRRQPKLGGSVSSLIFSDIDRIRGARNAMAAVSHESYHYARPTLDFPCNGAAASEYLIVGVRRKHEAISVG